MVTPFFPLEVYEIFSDAQCAAKKDRIKNRREKVATPSFGLLGSKPICMSFGDTSVYF